MARKSLRNVIDIFTREPIDFYEFADAPDTISHEFKNYDEHIVERELMEEIDLTIANEEITSQMLNSINSDAFFRYLQDSNDSVGEADYQFQQSILDYENDLLKDDTVEVIYPDPPEQFRKSDYPHAPQEQMINRKDKYEKFQDVIDQNEERKKRIARNRKEFNRVIKDLYFSNK